MHSFSKDAESKNASSSTKVISRSARAKKILNKKIKVNEHIKFDEDGEPVCQDDAGGMAECPSEEENNSDSDIALSVQPIAIDDFEKSKKQIKVGGIKIDKAKELLRSRDKMDRKRERERIRTTHRERRLKHRRMVNPCGDDEGETSEGVRLGRSVSSSKDDERSGVEAEEGDSTFVSSCDEEERTTPKRQKLDKKRRKKGRNHEQLGAEPEECSLMEDEELALHLLK